MNRSIKVMARVLLVVVVFSCLTLSGSSIVWAKEKGSTLAKQILGNWTLFQFTMSRKAKRLSPMGPNRGVL